MATLSVQEATRTGTQLSTTGATAAGDEFANTGREILYVNNGSGGSIDVTVAPGGTPGGLDLDTYDVAVAAGEIEVIGPFDTSLFNDSSGVVSVTYSSDTSVTVAVIQVP